MKYGKHTSEALRIKELEEIISRKDQEIKDIKTECIEQFKNIKDLCFCNDYDGKWDKLRKIHEIASDNFSALVKDLFISEMQDEKSEYKAKIIELSTPNQSNR